MRCFHHAFYCCMCSYCRLYGAKTMQELEKVWGELSASTVKPDDRAEKAYLRRKAELNDPSAIDNAAATQ